MGILFCPPPVLTAEKGVQSEGKEREKEMKKERKEKKKTKKKEGKKRGKLRSARSLRSHYQTILYLIGSSAENDDILFYHGRDYSSSKYTMGLQDISE